MRLQWESEIRMCPDFGMVEGRSGLKWWSAIRKPDIKVSWFQMVGLWIPTVYLISNTFRALLTLLKNDAQ